MDLTALQAELLNQIQVAVEKSTSREVIYCADWLGYLPFGLYHWIECEGEDISRQFPSAWKLNWKATDIEALANSGFLTKVDEWRDPDDDLNVKITYEVPA